MKLLFGAEHLTGIRLVAFIPDFTGHTFSDLLTAGFLAVDFHLSITTARAGLVLLGLARNLELKLALFLHLGDLASDNLPLDRAHR